MADEFEKTEAPTPRRRAEARESGNIARSTDLTAALMILASIVLLNWLGLRLISGMKAMLETMLASAHAANPTRPDDIWPMIAFGGRIFVWSTGPLLLAIAGVGMLAAASQVGLLLSLKPITPTLNKLSPLKGIKQLFDARAAMRLAMSLLKLLVIGALATVVIYYDLPWILHVGELSVGQAFTAACELVYALALKLAALLIILALLDYAFQRWKHEQDLKMSKQEVKEEMKRMEGDPLVKQRRARVARQLAMQRVAAAVPKADVVVTNPTHFSVALQYDAEKMRAPKVVAKGADFMAVRIRQIAAIHGIPIIERKPLARALYAGVEIGQEIPPEHYAAVAEILAYVYRLGERKAG